MADAGSVLQQAPARVSYKMPGCLASRAHTRVTFSLDAAAIVGEGEEEETRRVRDACFLCGRHLGGDVEVFMYRGDTPFCSEDCREEQMVLDEAREREKTYRRRQQYQSHRAASAKAAPAPEQRVCMRTGS